MKSNISLHNILPLNGVKYPNSWFKYNTYFLLWYMLIRTWWDGFESKRRQRLWRTNRPRRPRRRNCTRPSRSWSSSSRHPRWEKGPTLFLLFYLFFATSIFFRTLNVFYSWLVVAMVYYGLSFNTKNLGGDRYVSTFVSGFVEVSIPGGAVSTQFIRWKSTAWLSRAVENIKANQLANRGCTCISGDL